MPSSQGLRGPQRRIYRGGRPTNGRPPPKGSARLKVKHPRDAATALNHDAPQPEVGVGIDGRDHPTERDDADALGPPPPDVARATAEASAPSDALQAELRHLRGRVARVREGIQTSQGLANPETWRENCLLPAGNAAHEWRAILAHHLPQSGARAREEPCGAALHAAAADVFGLIQMALQSGPLAGSNPGYFKRCGGVAAGMGLEFLSDVLDAADGAEEEPVPTRKAADGEETSEDVERDAGGSEGTPDDAAAAAPPGEGDRRGNHAAAAAGASGTPEPSPTGCPRSLLLFTEKQEAALRRWHEDARKAREKDAPPSKAAARAQGAKSKKQREREQRRQRKEKKEKRGR